MYCCVARVVFEVRVARMLRVVSGTRDARAAWRGLLMCDIQVAIIGCLRWPERPRSFVR